MLGSVAVWDHSAKAGKNNPAIVMWSIGNEVGEADGFEQIYCRNCSSRLVKTIKDVDAARYVTMGS